jgi:hypothetical protein
MALKCFIKKAVMANTQEWLKEKAIINFASNLKIKITNQFPSFLMNSVKTTTPIQPPMTLI